MSRARRKLEVRKARAVRTAIEHRKLKPHEQ